MKISELIKQLQEMNPDHIVIMAKDSEGNGFTPLADIGEYIYNPETTWYGEIVDPAEYFENTYDDCEYNEDDEEQNEEFEQKCDCVVLWGTN